MKFIDLRVDHATGTLGNVPSTQCLDVVITQKHITAGDDLDFNVIYFLLTIVYFQKLNEKNYFVFFLSSTSYE